MHLSENIIFKWTITVYHGCKQKYATCPYFYTLLCQLEKLTGSFFLRTNLMLTLEDMLDQPWLAFHSAEACLPSLNWLSHTAGQLALSRLGHVVASQGWSRRLYPMGGDCSLLDPAFSWVETLSSLKVFNQSRPSMNIFQMSGSFDKVLFPSFRDKA